jgi:hypothetical protein
MKHIYLFILLIFSFSFGQQSYYNGIDFSLSGNDLFLELQTKISVHNSEFTYGQNRDTMKTTDDEDFNDTDNNDTSNTVWLIYGYNDGDGTCTTDRTRHEDDFGGTSCEYNREHTFPRSLAQPSMGDTNNSFTGIVADPHNIRPSDQKMNSDRGNKKFATGVGNAGDSNGGWYPGDEWKGDVARIMMYMYTRYGDQCKPEYVGMGSKEGNTEMLQLFLQWNIDDPVSEFEDQRNDYLELESVYNSRNPFIDNPYLATLIWGGAAAEDRWSLLSSPKKAIYQPQFYPNPNSNNKLHFEIINSIEVNIYDVLGKLVKSKYLDQNNSSIDITDLNRGVYLVKMSADDGQSVTKRLIRQ